MKVKLWISFVFLVGFISFFWYELYQRKNSQSSPSVTATTPLTGEPLPPFTLPDLWRPETSVSNKDLIKNKVFLIHVWATWCYACRYEHDMLMKLKNDYHLLIYSIDYKDNAQDAKNYLNENGNPYAKTLKDDEGTLTVDLGVYGTPETFILNKEGDIIYRHVGVITQDVWEETLYPIIQNLS